MATVNAHVLDAPENARFAATAGPEGWLLNLSGRWITTRIAAVDQELRALELPAGGQTVIDLSEVRALDTAGACLVDRTERALQAKGVTVSLRGIEKR